MTRDEIIKLVAETADQTRIDPISVADQTFLLDISEVERFAALVEQRAAAAEREECAKVWRLFEQKIKEEQQRCYVTK